MPNYLLVCRILVCICRRSPDELYTCKQDLHIRPAYTDVLIDHT
jgi:hypothetical protein